MKSHPPGRRPLAVLPLVLCLIAIWFVLPSYTQDEVPVGRSAVDESALDRPERRTLRPPGEKEGEDEGDESLEGTNEPCLAVDPNNPLHVAVASAGQINVSTDGGLTFGPPVYAKAPPGWGICGDSSLGYDSRGRLFWTYLSCHNALLVTIAQCDPTTGAILPGYPVSVGGALGYGENAANDKEWLGIDIYPGSPFRDRLYIVWTDVLLTSRVSCAYSADQGHTWTGQNVLSTSAEGFSWPPHVTTAPNGDVYVSYHAPRSTGIAGRVFLCRSTNGGVTFPQKTQPYPAGQADVTFNVQSMSATTIPKTDFWLQGNAQAYVMADPNVAGRIYVVAADDPDNNLSFGDASNIYLATSNDYGVTFGSPVRIDDGPGTTFAVMPTAAIDPHTGAMLVHWYDNRLGALNPRNNYMLDVFARGSSDGGVTWSVSRQINDKPFDPDLNAPCRFDCFSGPPTRRIGEYNGAGIAGETGFAAWCGNAPDGFQETVFDHFTFDLYPPTIAHCPPDTTVECADVCGVPAAQMAAWLSSFTASDSYDASPTLSNDAPPCFPMGETTVTFTARDDDGHSASCSALVRVEDTTAPAIDVTLSRDVLWPPSHELVEICGQVDVHDACDASPVVALVSIVSSDPDNDRGDANTTGDIQEAGTGTDDRCFFLRSERIGSTNERRYTIVYAAADDEGNVSYDTVSVRVPHDRDAAAVASDGFVSDGTALKDGVTQFTVVVPSAQEVDAAALDIAHIYLGNTRSAAKPLARRLLDLNGDDLEDVALTFAAKEAMTGTLGGAGEDLNVVDRTRETDGPLGIHFVTVTGVDYLIANIFALGDAVELPSSPAIMSGPPHVTAPTGTSVMSISPNPFNPETAISFHLERTGHVRIVIYDIRGAIVRRLTDETLPAGDRVARWNGADDAGRPASSGIYFVRMTAGSHTEARKIVMLK